MIHRIETQRLLLREWTEGDFAAFARFYADANSARFVGGQKDPEHAWRHLALQVGHWQLKGFGYWAVEEKTTRTFAGSVGLWQSPGWPELELGYWLVGEHRGKGYALEACLRCRDYARDVLGARSLVSYIDPRNEASIKLAKKLGAEYAGAIELASFGNHSIYRHFGDGQ